MDINKLRPKKNKEEIIKDAFIRLYQDEKRLRNFQCCNEHPKMREQTDKGICPVCNKVIGFGNPAEIHHTTYEHKCYYAYNKPRCDECFENHREQFEICKSKLICVHPECHDKIHNYN